MMGLPDGLNQSNCTVAPTGTCLTRRRGVASERRRSTARGSRSTLSASWERQTSWLSWRDSSTSSSPPHSPTTGSCSRAGISTKQNVFVRSCHILEKLDPTLRVILTNFWADTYSERFLEWKLLLFKGKIRVSSSDRTWKQGHRQYCQLKEQ